MKQLISYAALVTVALSATGADAQSDAINIACAKSGDERRVAVVSPGKVGATCDVQYTYVGSNTVKVPYHANSSAAFCASKAQDLVADLASQGYSCAPFDGERIAAAPTPAETPATDGATVVAEAPAVVPEPPQLAPVSQQPAPQQTVAVEESAASTPERVAEAAPVTEVAEEEPATQNIEIAAAADEAPTQTSAPAREESFASIKPQTTDAPSDGLGERLNEMLEQPSPRHAAIRGPASLTENATPNVTGAGRARAVGRLVGAPPPDEPAPEVELAAAAPAGQGVTPVTTASAQVDEPAAALTPTATPAAEPAAPSSAAPGAKKKSAAPEKITMRKPAEIIRATLDAQVAAWNEGNLDAFMETYWKSDNLKFISGTTITKGWSSTLKEYRNRYADDGGLGELDLKKVDVQQVTDDVAVVTGRFRHSKAQANSSGVFSLVMKRNNGAWRIVHDHTNLAAEN